MPGNIDELNIINTVESQCQFLVKELKKYLKKQLYREAVARTQRLISNNSDHLSDICASQMLKLIFLQSKAIIKLLSRNIYRKYFYPQITIKKLLKILNRNNSLCNTILVNKIQSKRMIEDESYRLKTYQRFGQQCNVFKYDIITKDFIHIAKMFQEIYLASVLYQCENFRNYNYNIEKHKKSQQLLLNLTQLRPKFSFKTQSSLIAIKLSLSKILFQNNLYSSCLKMINEIIEMLLNLHFKIRLWFQNKEKTLFSPQEKYKTLRKKNHYIKNVLKYLIICMIMMIRINMKCGLEDIAIEGIHIFNLIVEKSGENQLGNFRKYLMPEIYIYQQFCRYRAEKFQIQQIIEPLFGGMMEEMKTNLKSTKQLDDKNRYETKPNMYNFYNEKIIEFRLKLQHQTKKQQQQIKRTANHKLISYHINKPTQTEQIHSTKKVRLDKSKLLTKYRNPLTDDKSFSSNLGHTRESQNYLNLEKDIIEDLEISNRLYLSTHRVSPKTQPNRWDNIQSSDDNRKTKDEGNQVDNGELPFNCKLIQSKNYSLKIISKKHLNYETKSKQIIKSKKLVRSRVIKKQNDDKQINIAARTQKLQSIRSQMLNDLKSNIELLKEKKNNPTILIMKNSDSQDMFQSPKNYPHNIQSYSLIVQKYDHLVEKGNQIQKQEKENVNVRKNSSMMNLANPNFKDKLKHLNKKTKLQMFIEVLINHKQHFGIKKWSEKAQYIKKKHQLKQKFRSTRRTSSINQNGFKKLGPKIGFIAGDLLIHSLQEIEEINSPYNYQKKYGVFNNQHNYKLGMKSIQILMNSLEKQKQTYRQNHEKNLKISRTTRTERKNTQQTKEKNNIHHSVGKLSRKNTWMCKFAL